MRSPTIKLFSEQISGANAQRDDANSRLSIAQQEIVNKDRLLCDGGCPPHRKRYRRSRFLC